LSRKALVEQHGNSASPGSSKISWLSFLLTPGLANAQTQFELIAQQTPAIAAVNKPFFAASRNVSMR
jgi:hypothetical protein